MVTTSKLLQLLYMDLFNPMRTTSFCGKNFVFVNINDFSRFTCVLFLAHKSEAFDLFSSFCKHIRRECDHSICKNINDLGDEFEKKI